jgi:hypothetical protein
LLLAFSTAAATKSVFPVYFLGGPRLDFMTGAILTGWENELGKENVPMPYAHTQERKGKCKNDIKEFASNSHTSFADA